jgi:outer membrane PBP1 activator LpoA protein
MRLHHLLLALLLVACASGRKAEKIDENDISERVKMTLDESRELVRSNKLKPALAKLGTLADQGLNPVEKALKYNLKGVILFNSGEVDKALLNFEIAEKYTPKNTQLYSQVELNMASANFKLNQFNDLKKHLSMIDVNALSDAEKKKYAQLCLTYGTKFKDNETIVNASLMLLKDAKTFADVQNSNLYLPLRDAFKALNPGDRIEALETQRSQGNVAVAHLAQLEAEERYMAGDKSGAQDIVGWLRSEFSEQADVSAFIKEFDLRIENSTRINIANIGIVLPLTGDRSSFGQKALSGIDTGMKIMGLGENVKIFPKDSMDSPARGAEAVVDLIRSEKVAFIIGGLFPETAKAEYLEARKYGVLFISLSPVNLPKEEKNLHLIEVQGSIESQIEVLLSDAMIKKFGTRLGVVFPDNEGGKSYVDEIWRKANEKKLQVSTVAAFPKNQHDYRDTAQLFLGLKYPRERAEELEILEDVYAMEKTTIRRVQTLPPVIDFDWVFLASYPHEAVQLISTLGYYDANRIKVIGGPSWATRSMVNEQKNLGTLYFVGDDPKDLNQDTLKKFQEIYGKPASLIELLALDAMKIATDVLATSGEVSSRDEFDNKMKSDGSVQGLSTTWDVQDGVWLKKMNAMVITHGEIQKLFEATELN